MDESILKILEADKEAQAALDKRTQQKVQSDKEFETAKNTIDEANHAAYEIESQRLNQERDDQFSALQESLDTSYQQKKAEIVTLFEERSDEWVENLVKETLRNA